MRRAALLPGIALVVLAAAGVAAQPLEVGAWVPSWRGSPGLDALRARPPLDAVAVPGYTIARDGGLRPIEGPPGPATVIQLARSLGMATLVGVSNSSDDDFDPAALKRLCRPGPARSRHLAALAALARTTGADGIELDYELLGPRERQGFTSLVREAAAGAHRARKLLALAVHPKTGDDGGGYGAQAQDWVALAEVVDRITVMAYDYHGIATAPGPIAPPEWVRAVVAYARRVVPDERLVIGLPLHAFDWVRRGDRWAARQLRHEDVEAMRIRAGARVEREPAPHFRALVDGEMHEVWFEDAGSLARTLAAARSSGARAIALWSLGGEDRAVWRLFARGGR